MAAAAEGSTLIESSVPDVNIDHGFGNPGNINVPTYCAGKKIVLVGLPGAFTPT